jgi:NAD(P)-dependent dehydrogenase (short-subunit alcohol dehydrogenase family)
VSKVSGQLSGKVAVITGASTGIGFAIAGCFVAEGARVFITGRRKDILDSAAGELGEAATGVDCDASRLADLDALYEQVAADAGRIDVLVANAGGGGLSPLGQVTEEEFDETFATNAKGVFFTVQKALPLLTEGASVILTGSTAGIRPGPAFSVYGATKAAVRTFARGGRST